MGLGHIAAILGAKRRMTSSIAREMFWLPAVCLGSVTRWRRRYCP